MPQPSPYRLSFVLLFLMLAFAFILSSSDSAAQGDTTPEVTEPASEPSLTATATDLPTETPSETPTERETATLTETGTETATLSPSPTLTLSTSPTATLEQTVTETPSPTASLTPSLEPVATATSIRRITATPNSQELENLGAGSEGLASGEVIYRTVTNVTELVQDVALARGNPSDTYVLQLQPGTYTLTPENANPQHYSYLYVGNGKLVIVGLQSYLANTHPENYGNNAIIERANGSLELDIFHVSGSGSLTLYNVIVRNGGGPSRFGGGGFVNWGTLNIYNSIVQSNTVDSEGGAVYQNQAARLALINTIFRANESIAVGGAMIIYPHANTQVQADCAYFDDNDVGGWGGAIFVEGGTLEADSISIHSSNFENNSASAGGAIFNNATQAVNASGNWWNALPPATDIASDDAIYGNVDYANAQPGFVSLGCSVPPLPASTQPTSTPIGGGCGGFSAAEDGVMCQQLPIECTSFVLNGVNLRSSPSMNAIPTLLTGGTVQFSGRYYDGSDTWLRVADYSAQSGVTGWVNLKAFEAYGYVPCDPQIPNNHVLADLPVMDATGFIIPVPNPTPTSPPRIVPTVPPGAPIACEAYTANPFIIRYEPYLEEGTQIDWVEAYMRIKIYYQNPTGVGGSYLGSTSWYYASFVDETGITIAGWIHSLVVDASSCGQIPTLQITPRPPTITPTLTPSNTPPPDLTNDFPLPMDAPDARLTAQGGSLNLTYPIPSRDIQALCSPGVEGFELQTPANATVLVVDSDGGAAPGRFISIRIDMADVPASIKTRLQTLNNIQDNRTPNRFGNIPDTSRGSIHIGYAHLSSIASGIEPVNIRNGISQNEIISRGTTIGYSGTSGNSYGAHLDIAAYYVPDGYYVEDQNRNLIWQVNLLDPIQFEGYDDDFYRNPLYRYDYDAYWGMYGLAKRDPSFGSPIVIDPLVLWPSLEASVDCD